MDENQKRKLVNLITQRGKKMESIERFSEYFEIFARKTLKNAVLDINDLLMNNTNESLKLFLEDPYNHNRNTRYFVMIQLIYGNRLNSFFLDNTRHYPSLIFEGDELTGKIKVTTKIKENAFSSSETDISNLNVNNTYDMVINFIENIYKQ